MNEQKARPVAMLLTGFSMIAGLGCSSTPPPETPGLSEPTSEDPARVEVFGVELAGPRSDLLERYPDLELAPGPSTGEIETGRVEGVIAGFPVELSFTVHEGRIATISFELTGETATIEAYRRILAELEARIGDGVSTRCVSEEGIALDDYIAEVGRGHLGTRWDEERFWATFSVSKSFSPQTSFRISGMIGSRQVRLPCPDDLVCGAKRQPHSNHSNDSKETSEGCRVDLSEFPSGSIAGLEFGMTRNEVEAVLGVSLTRSAMSHDAEYQLAGIEGQLALYFHDGCLATMLFVIREENATVEAFRTLHRWAQRELDGQVDTARCESEEGIPLATHIANGHGQLNAMWRDAEPFEASLHLRSLYGRNGHTELIFEASYMPLRPYAPRIDF